MKFKSLLHSCRPGRLEAPIPKSHNSSHWYSSSRDKFIKTPDNWFLCFPSFCSMKWAALRVLPTSPVSHSIPPSFPKVNLSLNSNVYPSLQSQSQSISPIPTSIHLTNHKVNPSLNSKVNPSSQSQSQSLFQFQSQSFPQSQSQSLSPIPTSIHLTNPKVNPSFNSKVNPSPQSQSQSPLNSNVYPSLQSQSQYLPQFQSQSLSPIPKSIHLPHSNVNPSDQSQSKSLPHFHSQSLTQSQSSTSTNYIQLTLHPLEPKKRKSQGLCCAILIMHVIFFAIFVWDRDIRTSALHGNYLPLFFVIYYIVLTALLSRPSII